MSRRLATTLTALPAVAVLGLAMPATADEITDFYSGKTVTIMVPSGLGGTLGLYGRLVTEHLGEHIPGKPTVIIQSRPGGGGTKGAAYAITPPPRTARTSPKFSPRQSSRRSCGPSNSMRQNFSGLDR
jgi:tripartite-type tricarboxylate transporter receptor subunit TctC